MIIDEVQRVPELLSYIQGIVDKQPNRRFVLSGSSNFALLRSVTQSLAGRVGMFELLPMAFSEVRGMMEGYSLDEILFNGLYPAICSKKNVARFLYPSYIKTYLERDVRKLSAVQDLDDFRRFMVAVAARTGQMLNYANIADEISKDAMTVKKWMSILEASGIVYLLEPYTPSVLKKAIKTPKVYFRDTGLAAYLTRWLTPEALAYGAMSGAMFETFVISEILKSYSNRGIDYRYCVSYYRGRDKKKVRKDGQEYETESEIDLIIEENGTLYPIEIKQSPAVTADEASAFTVLDKVEEKRRGMGAIICTCPQPNLLRDNLLQLPVWYV
jgi:predicted AAA+ superfamily ATPase